MLHACLCVQATQLQDSTSFSGFRAQGGVFGGGPGSDRLSTMRGAFAVSILFEFCYSKR